jgi:S1-C subfamily serine protease
MRKLVILMMILSIVLSSCFGDSYPKDSDAQLLYEQYRTFVQNDISTEQRLQSLINEISLNLININIIVEVKIYNQLGVPVETRQSSGFIYKKNENDYDVITLISLSDINPNYTIQYIVKDVQGKSYDASLILSSSENQLALMRFSSTRLILPQILLFAKGKPLVGEPLILIGHQFKIVNAMSMGIVLGNEKDELLDIELILTSIRSDSDGNGGVILNMGKEIVGIQFENKEGITRIIGVDTIIEFLNDNQ